MSTIGKATNKKICAVIQATYKSDLFPGKSVVKIAGRTVLEHIVSRVKKVKGISDIILATSETPENDTLVEEAKRLNIKVFRGSETDVIARLCGAVEYFHGETILKINGNYPLFDPFLANDLIYEHINGEFEFSFNEHLYGTVYGIGCEVIEKRLLLDTNRKRLTPVERESGLLYFHQNQRGYKVNIHKYLNPRPHYKVCVDTEKDLNLIDFIFKNLKQPYTENIIELLDNNPVLAESNKYESVREVGLDKFYLFPEKINALKKSDFQGIDYTYPISIELSLTNRCNFNCVWCSDKDLRVRQEDDLDFKVLKNLLLDIKEGGTTGIVIEGGGEPTIHKNFEDVVNLAYNLNFGVGLITNGSMTLKEDILGKLEWIRVSLDASNPGEHKKLKGTTYFEKVMSNIKDYCASKATVGVGYVVTSENIGSLESLTLRLSQFGVSYIQYRPVIDHPELDTDVDLSYLKRYENGRFFINIDGMSQNRVDGNGGLPCVSHSLTTVVTADGSVFLCGRLNIYEWFEPIGNITKESFRDIWLGEKRVEQANMVLDKDFCKKHCPRCRITKFNQLFERLRQIKTRNFI